MHRTESEWQCFASSRASCLCRTRRMSMSSFEWSFKAFTRVHIAHSQIFCKNFKFGRLVRHSLRWMTKERVSTLASQLLDSNLCMHRFALSRWDSHLTSTMFMHMRPISNELVNSFRQQKPVPKQVTDEWLVLAHLFECHHLLTRTQITIISFFFSSLARSLSVRRSFVVRWIGDESCSCIVGVCKSDT